MIKGIGIDMIEIERIKQSISRQPRFVQRILTNQEHQRFQELRGQRRYEFIAGRFAAKEAFAKAVGTGIGQLSFQHIEVLSGPSGAPVMVVEGYDHEKIWVSISHSTSHAIAQVVIETMES